MRPTFFQIYNIETPTNPLPTHIVCNEIVLKVREHIPCSPNFCNTEETNLILKNIIRSSKTSRILTSKIKTALIELQIERELSIIRLCHIIQNYKKYENSEPYLIVSAIETYDPINDKILKSADIQFTETDPNCCKNKPNNAIWSCKLPAYREDTFNSEDEIRDSQTTNTLIGLSHRIGNCKELTGAVKEILVYNNIPELHDYFFVQIQFPEGDHILTIVFTPKDPKELNNTPDIPMRFNDFAECCDYFNDYAKEALIIDPWIGESTKTTDLKTIMQTASRLNQAHHFSGRIETTNTTPCYNKTRHSPTQLLSPTYQADSNALSEFIRTISPLTNEINIRLNHYRARLSEMNTSNAGQSAENSFNTL